MDNRQLHRHMRMEDNLDRGKMSFGAIIRLAFGSIVFFISAFLIRKSRLSHKRRWIIVALAAVVMLTIISGFIRIENVFVTFSSPKVAYHYSYSGNVELIVEGKEADFVVGVKDDKYIYEIVPKVENGWKLKRGVDLRQISQTISDAIVIYVYQYKNTDDYYITVFNSNGGPSDITDNRDSEFQYLSQFKPPLEQTFYTYYAHLDGLDDNYVLTEDGKAIKVQN